MEKIGLVLSGGGGKGSFQIGALKALSQAGKLDFVTGISGASIGTINACALCTGKLDVAEKMWKNIDPLQVLEPDIVKGIQITQKNLFTSEGLLDEIIRKYEDVISNQAYELFARSRDGAFSRDGLVKIINEQFELDRISQSPMSFYTDVCRCTDNKLELEYIKLNGKSREDIIKLVLASSALPFIYDAVEYKGNYYRDGGLMDNVPIKPLYDEGFRKIIVIGLKKNYGIDYSKFDGCEFIKIMPSHSLGDFVDGTLDFSASGAKFRIALGYRNTKRILEAYESGKINSPDFEDWFNQMSALDYEAAKQDVKQENLLSEADEHIDKLLSIYNKYM